MPTERPARSLMTDAWWRFRRHRLALFGCAVLLCLLLAITLGPLAYQYYLIAQLQANGSPPREAHPDLRSLIEHFDLRAILQPPSPVHPFGTDDLGRDLLARCLYGGRISLAVGLAAMLIAIALGTAIGAIAGFYGGMIDQILMRLTDLCLALPGIPITLLIVYLFREPVVRLLGSREVGVFVIMVLVIGGLAWMSTARIVRATLLSLKQQEFVTAAIALGVRHPAIIIRHLLPNAIGPIVVAATLEVGSAIIAESTISFLGVGFPPDTPTWGRLVTDGSQYLQAAPWLALCPGGLIFVTVLSINFVGDGLRDAFAPQ
ncbi:ABC transporter permease [Candidatus Oscillochloris fontis]|uniref:ABC transporter permease n=1 Tax=Candidatus Oscillochloris fontis TaxID=2496868 RepID=UPI00101DEF07|nr:ABC transporter permease [Candidatus Oscillochloris fontis]